jgi:hypothetical protein
VGKAINRCPWCGKKDCVPEIVFDHDDRYGGGFAHAYCVKCNSPITVHTVRIVRVCEVSKGDHLYDDWGYKCDRELLLKEDREKKK